MSKHVVLVMLAPDDPDSEYFRRMIGRDAELRNEVEILFAAPENAHTVISEAEVIVTGGLSAELLDRASKLKWVSFWSAGMESKATPEILARNILLTNASGVHGPNIAEHVMAMMLMFTRRMHHYMHAQIEGKWQRNFKAQSGNGTADELTGQTLGIVGLGRIGEALLKRARAFDMQVIALKRDTSHQYNPDLAPDILFAPNKIDELLERADHVCIALPYTRDTHHLINAERLSHMKPSAYLYNIARGKIIDEPALIRALEGKQLAGAGLDVFEQEPLLEDSPLWKLDNVIITPHVSGLTPHYFERKSALFGANLKEYLRGQPLSNLYNHERGY